MEQAGLLCHITNEPLDRSTQSIGVSVLCRVLIIGRNLTEPAAYQGSNPISDIFSKWALQQTVKYLPRISEDPHGDTEARQQMLCVKFSS